ncbi:MAG: hypothetical protein JNK75_03275 [Betaproteobacteria bacterium]|nr:hypothetical protein [Betaproteobacteria bacterium]
MPIELRLWWSVLIAVAVFNVAVWACLAATHGRQRPWVPDAEFRARQLGLLLAAGYVFGCAYRSLFPVFDVPRITLVDSWLASALVGRSVATVAELCFAAQWALPMRELAAFDGGRRAARAAVLVLPLIVVAECASWHSVITGMNLGHVIEETLWGICAVLVLAGLWSVRSAVAPAQRGLLKVGIVTCAGYAAYMFAVDVPQYFSRWMADLHAGREFAALGEGVADAALRRHVLHDWQVWRGEVVWMTAYFSVGVWVSLALAVLSPRIRHADVRLPRAPRKAGAVLHPAV